jgi:hypothetical protein
MFDGWIQVRNSSGKQGIVPSSYVEYLNNQDVTNQAIVDTI